MHAGEFYLFASGLTDELRAEHVLAEHEAAHFGLRAILGPSLTSVMNHIYNNNASVRRAAKEFQKRGKLSNAKAAEEIIVDIPTAELVKLKGWRKVVNAVRDWLENHGFVRSAAQLDKWLDGSLTDQDRADLFVASLVSAARDHMRGMYPAAFDASKGNTMLSDTLADDIVKQEKWLTTEAKARGFKSIEDLVDTDYPLFEKLAKLWRDKNPATNGMLLSRSPIKSVSANIDRGLNAIAKAITEKTTVHRAMFRSGLGWVDFVWGDEGSLKNSGKTKGGKGISHILEARMRKDGLSEKQAAGVLGNLVRVIASGAEFDRKEVGDSVRVGVKHDGYIAWLAKNKSANAWVVTGYEENPDGLDAGRATSKSTQFAASLTRSEQGAGF